VSATYRPPNCPKWPRPSGCLRKELGCWVIGMLTFTAIGRAAGSCPEQARAEAMGRYDDTGDAQLAHFRHLILGGREASWRSSLLALDAPRRWKVAKAMCARKATRVPNKLVQEF